MWLLPNLMNADSAARAAFAIAENAARRYGLHVFRSGSDDSDPWATCFTKNTFVLCGRAVTNEIQFRMYEMRTTRFSPWADSLHAQLFDTLRTYFGARNVRKCRWHAARPPEGPTCES